MDEASLRRNAELARDRLDGANFEARRMAKAMEQWVGEFCVAQACQHGLPHRHHTVD